MIGKRFKYIRKLRGYSQDDIADYLSVSVSAVKKWEQDKNDPNTGLLIQLAELFKVSVDYLLDRSDKYIIDTDNPLFEKIDRLDNIDRIKTEGYVDNLLENTKYKTPVSERAS